MASLVAVTTACGGAPPSDAGSSSTDSTDSTGATGRTTGDTTAVDTTAGSVSTGGSGETSASSVDSSDEDSSSGGGPISPGCGNAGATTGESVRQVEIQGVMRSFIVDAPAVIDSEQPLALAFVFHGNGGSGQGIQGMGLQLVPGAQEQAVFVFPDGLPFKGFGVGWNGSCDQYDMELVDTMLAMMSAEYCIDPNRIFAAGFSWGGDFCQSLACCRGDVVRAIAPASGPELYPSIYPEACPDTERPAFRMTYADNDAYSPEMFAAILEWQRTEHGCAAETAPVEPSPCVAYQGCDEPVIACEYPGLGHAWPSDWATETWAFFSQLD